MFFLTYILCYNFAKINHGDPHFKKNSRKTTPHLTDKILVSNVHDIFSFFKTSNMYMIRNHMKQTYSAHFKSASNVWALYPERSK